MATARSLPTTTPGPRRRRGRWLRPRGVIRGRPTFEYNRVYGSGPRTPWLPPAAARSAVGRPTGLLMAGSVSGTIEEPARWWLRHRYRVIAVDCAVIVLAMLLGVAPATAGSPGPAGPDAVTGTDRGAGSVEPTLWALGIAALWLLLMFLGDLWCVTALRSGRATTRPLVRRAGLVFVGVGSVAFVVDADPLRGFLLLSVPLGVLGLLIARAVFDRHVRAVRACGVLPGLVLITGSDSDLGRHLAARLPDLRGPTATVCIADTRPTERSVGELVDRIRTGDVDLLVLAEPEQYTPAQIAELAWNGLGVGTDLMVPAPSMGGRLVRPAAAAARLVGGAGGGVGIPELGLLTVDPRPPRSARAARLVIDRVLAAVGAILLLPAVLVATIAAAIAQGPPVFVDSERVGRDGRVFRVWAFRCVAGTPGGSRDTRRGSETSAAGPTTVGRVLRRSGLENVPGLLAVLSGDLALIGPRPAPPAVGVRSTGRPWLRPGWTGRWRDPVREDPAQVDGEHLGRDLWVLARLIRRRWHGRGRA